MATHTSTLSEVDDTIIYLHQLGHTPLEIAGMVPRSRAWVYKLLEAQGLKPHRTVAPEVTIRQAAKVEHLYSLGVPMTKIARRANLTTSQVKYLVRTRNLKEEDQT